MGFTDSAFGNIQKASLIILDKNSIKESRARGELENRNAPLLNSKQNSNFQKNQTQINAPSLGGGQNSTSSKIKGTKFTVQFNPTELTISGRAGGYFAQRDYSDAADNTAKGELKMAEAPLYMTLSTRLIFDRVVPGDAMTGITSTSASSMIQRGASLLYNQSHMSAGSGNEEDNREGKKNNYVMDQHSVRGEVEALIGAVRNKQTRLIAFQWGENINYVGNLNSVSASYVMFNTNGEPIRAFVDLSLIIASDGDPELVLFSEYLWYEKYNKAFGKDVSYVDSGQKVGSIIGW